ncbi:MAG: hypothetical protein K2O45_07220 [Oscillospiraceae bacterium]|nr:hypothetical protein [Oscillospiraceae bacterium]
MKEKRTPWPRWAKILRNLLLAVLLGFMMWDVWGHPTFFYMEDLRRRERRALFPEPEAVVELNTIGGVKYRIDVAEGMAVTSYPLRGDFFTNANASFHSLEEGPALLCVSRTAERPDEFGQPLTCAAYVAVHPPEDAAGAVLTLSNESAEHMVEGIREGDVFLFYDHEYATTGSALHMMGFSSYELEFSDKDGNSICQVSG